MNRKKKAEIEKVYSLSPMQEGMLFHFLTDKTSSAYFEQSDFAILGALERDLLEESFNRLIRRYEVLRTVFRSEGVRKPVQIVLKERTFKLHFEDISSQSPEQCLEVFKRKDREKGFDLTKDLLIRAALFKTAKDAYRLVLSFHHILMDGWCLGIMFKDLVHFYRYLKTKPGGALELEQVTPYSDYITWLKNQDKEEGLAYWESCLEDYFQPATLPKTTGAESEKSYRWEEYRFLIDEPLTAAMKKIAGEHHVTLNTLFQTLWGILLQEYNNSDDVVFGAVVSGRPAEIENVENILGLFINTIPVRIRLENEEGYIFSRLLDRVQQQAVLAKSREYLPLSEIQSRSQLKNRLIDIIMGFENYSLQKEVEGLSVISDELGFTVEHKGIYEQTNYDFNIIVVPGKSLEIRFTFNASVYGRDFVENVSIHLNEVIRQVAANPGMDIREIEFLSSRERERLLVDFNATAAEYPGDKTVHGLFAEQVERTPGNIAVRFPLDLSDIYETLESDGQVVNSRGLDRLGRCCFRKNPYIFQKSLEIAGHSPPLELLKTHGHNNVVADANLSKLIDLFDGERSAAGIFSGLKDMDAGPEFLFYPIEMGDLLEITFDLHSKPLVFSARDFSEFSRLLKELYRAHLIELSGMKDGREEGVYFPTGGFKEKGGPGEETALTELFNLHRREKLSVLSSAGIDVLLLGDTPGMPTTGLLYLASYLKRKGINACCQFYDFTTDYPAMKENIEVLLESLQPKIVAVSLKWFLYISRVFDIGKIVKAYAAKTSSHIKVVVGGNTASYYWEDVFKNEAIDYLIRGDGEEPLLTLCRGEEKPENIPNIVYRAKGGKIIENPVTYVQDKTHSPGIYLSHLEEILLSDIEPALGTFFIYTHKGCVMNCLYCGGCSEAQQKTFNRKKVLQRGVEEVRKDILAALKYASTFQFDFDTPNDRLVEYCREIWEGIDLSSHFCIYANLSLPSPELLDLVQKTFKYVYCDVDITTLAQRHRMQLASMGLVKPQPGDEEILAFLDRCEAYDNIEVRINLITGLPYFTEADIAPGERLLDRIINTYSCFGELHWARLHAQPGAFVVENAGMFDMHSYASTYGDFLSYSEKNFNSRTGHQRLEYLNYPYIYFNDDRLNAKVTRFYSQNNLKVEEYKKGKRQRLSVSRDLSYRELNRKACELAAGLREKGVEPGTVVGLMLERSPDIVIGILGVLKAGAAYLPIDPTYPEARVDYMLADSHAKVLVRKVSAFRGPGTIPSTSTCRVNPANLAYVIYTSGTTGKPKGVGVSHGNLVNYVYWFARAVDLTEADRSVLTSSFAFDLGYTTLYPPLLRGGECHILPREMYLSPGKFLNYLKEKGMTYIKMAPSLFNVIVNHSRFTSRTCAALRFAVIGGEAIDTVDIERAHTLVPHLQVMNHYGPTEATIGSVAHVIDFNRFEAYKKRPVIGAPIANAAVYIMNRNFRLSPVGVAGELCISGSCLAGGYLNNPELTAERFCLRRPGGPYSSYMPYVFYRTGDLARWLPHGNIEFLGRIDQQVKVKGYRIELGEIENKLLTHHRVNKAAVITRENKNNETYLCAYVVPAESPVKQGHGGTVVYGEAGKSEMIVDRFEEQVERNPGAAAIEGLTYERLNREAGRLARAIGENYDDRYALSEKERTRYKRQLLLAEWGVEAQEKIKGTTVFVAGAGGGGSPTIMQLALLGFGTIRICDFDVVELSNLNRQFLHDEERIGKEKALSAQETINRINPHVKVVPITEKLTADNVFELVSDASVIFDMFDGPADKFILSQCAAALQIPHVIISMADINAYAAVLHTPHTPCYHCIFDKKKLEAIEGGMKRFVENYSKKPLAVAPTSLFISTGTVVNEALKILLGFTEPAYNKFFYFNQRGSFENFRYTASYRSMTHLFSEHFKRISREQGFDWEVGWRGNLVEVLDIEPDPGCPVCGEKGKEKLQTLKERAGKVSAAADVEPALTGDGRVALLLDYDGGMAAAMLGTMKAGKTYVPLVPHLEKKDLIHHLEDSQARLIITGGRYKQLAKDIRNKVNKNIPVITIDDTKNSSDFHEEPFDRGNRKEHVEYLLYSSGSHGVPGAFSQVYSALLKGETCDIEGIEPQNHPDREFSVELRAYLQGQLPDYMIPSFFVPIDEIPLTPNGKIDFKSLPEPGTAVPGTEYAAPTNETEMKLAQTWAEVFGVEQMGIHDNFFELGLDSIKAIQVSARLQAVGIKVEINDIFRNPTIKQLAGYARGTDQVEGKEKGEAVVGRIPLTPIQHWFFAAGFAGSHHYNQAVMLYRKEGFEVKILEAVFTRLTEHHDALRITYRKEPGGGIIQENHGRNYPLGFRVWDLRQWENAADELQIKINQVQQSIDLEKGPLMKVGLFQMEDGDRLLIVIHHLVIDTVSWRILVEDIERLYLQYRSEQEPELPAKTGSFKKWAEALGAYADSDEFLKEKDYWQQVESALVEEIKTDFPVEDNYIKDTRSRSFRISETETGQLLTTVHEAFGTEINDILLTALGLSIRDLFGIASVAIAMEGHGREPVAEGVDITRTVGWFTSIYPVVLDISGEPGKEPARRIKTVKEYLRRVPHKGIGYGILKYLTADSRKPGMDFKGNPRISFNYLGQFDADMAKLSFSMAEEPAGNAQSINAQRVYQLEVSGMVTEKQLVMSVTYNEKHFKEETIDALVRSYKTHLVRLISFCTSRQEREYTPSDFTYRDLTIESVERICREYPVEDIYTLSPMQESILFTALYGNTSSLDFQLISYRLRGETDTALIKKSLDELVRRHDVLRTAFVYEGVDHPVQVVLKERAAEFYYEDIRHLGDEIEKDAYTDKFKEKEKQRRLDFSKDILMRVAVFRLEEARYEFIWFRHHILMDGWCTGILITEFSEIYTALLKQVPPGLPAVKPYRTYIRWLQERDKAEARRYWNRFLGGYEEMAGISRMRRREAETHERGYDAEDVVLVLEKEASGHLGQLARRNNVTLNTVIQAVWGIVLGKYSGARDVVFGSVVSGRPAGVEGVETMVGLFINTVPVRIRWDEETTVGQLLRKIQTNALDSEPYHYYPLADVQAQHVLKQNLVDHIMAFENFPIARQVGIFQLETVNHEASQSSSYDFNVLVNPGEQVTIVFAFNTHVYKRDVVERIAGQVENIVGQILQDKDDLFRVEDISMAHDLLEVNAGILKEESGDFEF